MPQKHLSRLDWESGILSALKVLADNGVTPELTAYGFAKRMDRQVSYVLYAVLADMVARHLLTVRDEALGNRCTRTWYGLPEGSYKINRSREIKVNGKLWAIQEGF